MVRSKVVGEGERGEMFPEASGVSGLLPPKGGQTLDWARLPP